MTATKTPMPASLTPNQYTVIASGSAANIRRGPGLAYNSTGGLLKNASTTVYGRNTDGSWIYVAIPGQPGTFGWVTALPQYVTVSVNVMNLPLIPYSQPVPAYIQNCTDHTLLANPGSIAITDHTRKQFYPNDYQIYDENVKDSNGNYLWIRTFTLVEGQTYDIAKDGNSKGYTCP